VVCGQPGRFWPLVRRIIKPSILVVMLMMITMFAEVVRDVIKIFFYWRYIPLWICILQPSSGL